MSNLLDYLRKFSPKEIDQAATKHKLIESNFNQRVKEMGLDVIISPTSYHCAFRNTEAIELGSVFQYLLIWNALHYPTGVVPVTKVLKEETNVYTDNYNDHITKTIRKTMAGSEGMPIGIQVSAPKWKDEVCIAAMKLLEESLNFKMDKQF